MDEIISYMGEYMRNQLLQQNNDSENICNQEPLNFILIGHSQGGAAVGQVCTI